MRRVVITAAGAVTSLGLTAAETMAAMREGRAGIGALDFEDVDRLQIRIGGQIKTWDADARFSRQEIALFDPFAQFAMVAAAEALDGLDLTEEEGDRAGVVLGVGGGGQATQDSNYRAVFQQGKNRVHPLVVPRAMNNSAASHISMRYGLRGPNYTVSTACASSNHAMGQAFLLVRSGVSDVMVTGGAESLLCFGGIKCWEALRVMSKDGCRPFSKTRNGMVQGEGAAIFVLETYERAAARGADILAEITGFAMTSDASDIVVPNRDGAVRAMRGALRDGGIDPDAIGYINAHGTGTTVNDRTEVAAVREVFGDHADRLALSSTKSMHGHLLGGTGAVEALSCILAVRDGVLAPTIGYEEPDPECDLNHVPNEAQEAPVTDALSNAFAFGGLNAVLAFRRA